MVLVPGWLFVVLLGVLAKSAALLRFLTMKTVVRRHVGCMYNV